MSQFDKQVADAATNVMKRLLDMRRLWLEAADAYFDPDKFVLMLQQCITTSRTVTFIVQSNKAAFHDFDAWYASYQERWRGDPIMTWARDARNTIEKQGDLETHSQVRAELIAGFLPGPATEWSPSELFASPLAIWRGIPEEYLVPQVIENGTLLIERRWVASSLPDTEVLQALAHVDEQFCDLIVDLLQRHGMTAPSGLMESRPEPMGQLAMDRALYLSVESGQPVGVRLRNRPLMFDKDKARKKSLKRYGISSDWTRLKNATTFREVAEAYFEHARVVMAKDGFYRSLAFLLRGTKIVETVGTEHPDRASRYVMMRELAKFASACRADGVILLSEAWTAHGSDVPESGYPADAANRGEALALIAGNSAGETVAFDAVIVRKKPGGKKVRRLEPTRENSGRAQFILMPFQAQWGCLTDEIIEHSVRSLDEIGVGKADISG
ncbi:hypothetical protein [Sphingomonas sp. Leaf28]|uniref:hypothetical protein n=1 Tax=Sphingomonas sp. Leaf28 TaxID=1735695 RepID=UPI0006FBEA0C|nr:hypothetical protein [Sphingomonas sp. Leaf28]KQN09088.1 hypothetical protein ASE79_14645 [Sphingomonas sp. Leaf28]